MGKNFAILWRRDGRFHGQPLLARPPLAARRRGGMRRRPHPTSSRRDVRSVASRKKRSLPVVQLPHAVVSVHRGQRGVCDR